MIDGARQRLERKYGAGLLAGMACSAWATSATFMLVNGDIGFTNWRIIISDVAALWILKILYPLLKRWRPELLSLRAVEDQDPYGEKSDLGFKKTSEDQVIDRNLWKAQRNGTGTIH